MQSIKHIYHRYYIMSWVPIKDLDKELVSNLLSETIKANQWCNGGPLTIRLEKQLDHYLKYLMIKQ